MEQSGSSGEHFDSVFYPQYHKHRYCTAVQSIDTVRALHQTVVSLRSALDESRQEIEKLRKQIVVHSEIQEARPCLHLTATSQSLDHKTLGDKVTELEKIYYKNHSKPSLENPADLTSSCPLNEELKKNIDLDAKKASSFSLVPHISISTQNINDTSTHTTGGFGNTNNQMASRIDVKIKVSSNINVDVESSTGTSERSLSPQQSEPESDVKDEKSSQRGCADKRENPKVEVQMFEDSNTRSFNVDAKNLKVKVTSEDNVNITKSSEKINIHQSSSEYLNLDIDEMSEGDNSVFTEGATTPIEQRLQQVDDNESENEVALNEDGELPREERDENEGMDIPEEVDDIELIFSSDDNKDVIQEDLVSLSEYEPWNEENESGAPVLTKFSTLTSEDRDREAYYEKKKSLKAERQLREKEKSSPEDYHGREKSIESTDSLSFDKPDYKASSMEKDSSIENSTSRESYDAFANHVAGIGKKWTNVNVLIETDMSKVGIGDENILDKGRRNTCPNPPLYRYDIFIEYS
jgi:hypothetical protein